MTNKLRSSQLLSQLYWQYQRRRLIGLLALVLLCVILGGHALLVTGMALQLKQVSLNFLFTALLLGFVAVIGNYSYAWMSDGISSRRFFHQWESHHQDIAHRTDLVVYSERQPEEIQRLGYSQELIHAEDEILIERLQAMAVQSAKTPLRLPLALLAVVIVSSGLMWLVNGDALQAESRRIAEALVVYDAPSESLSLQVPSHVTVKRGDPVILAATIEGDAKGMLATLHREFRSGWESVSVAPENGWAEFSLPSLNREIIYYISLGGAVSNRGAATPLDPPTLAKGSIVVQPPGYTNLPQETINHWRAFSAPRGSHVAFSGVASASLTSATAFWLGNAYPLNLKTGVFAVEIQQVHQSSDFFVSMQDENGMVGQSPKIQIELIDDATPQVEIMAPPENMDVPGGMAIGVSAHIQDDYGARIMLLHSQLNYDEATNKSELVWKYTEEQAADINRGMDFYVNFEWNIAPFEMYPGDELTFYLEAFDEDPFHGPKAARSKTHTIRYPSLLDLVDELNQEEDSHIEDLNEILAEQRDIRQDLDDTLERIAEKSEMQGSEEQGEEQFWVEKQELETIKDRQEELIEEAKRIEEELEQYQQSAVDELSPEEKEEQGFTPDTLEKLERVQELMKEMVDQESQQLMEQMELAIEQLSQEMDAEQLEDLNFSVENFEEQLDRTLSMLVSTFQFRQLEGLRQTAEELAQRQDHLMRETEQLEQEVSGLQSEIQEMEEKAQELAQAEQAEQQKANDAQGENAQSGEQNKNEQSPSGENNESPEQSDDEKSEASAEQQRLQEEIEKKKEELSAKQNLLAQRQERLQQDAQAMMKQMEQMKEEMSENNPMLAQQMEQMLEQLHQAVQQLQSGQPQQARQNQKKALDSLQQMSQQMNKQMENMGMQNMEEDSNQIKRLVDRGLFLSNEMEELTESVMGQSEALAALRTANAYLRELKRVRTVWKGVAAQNPFLNRRSDELMQQSERRLREAVEAGQGVKWLGLHETRQSLIALNQALRQMMQDNQDMQQQMQQQQSSMQNFQQQMQQMMSQQKSLNQMMQQLKQQGEQGQKMAEQLKRMAQQQSRIRKEIEKMMQQNRHARQLKNRLQGIYDEMREVEKLLEAGESGAEVEERQQRIMTRMLEAGTMQEEDKYGRERREEAPEAVEPDSPEGDVKTDWQDALRRSLEQPPMENIPPQYRDAIKNHYIRLSEEALPG